MTYTELRQRVLAKLAPEADASDQERALYGLAHLAVSGDHWASTAPRTALLPHCYPRSSEVLVHAGGADSCVLPDRRPVPLREAFVVLGVHPRRPLQRRARHRDPRAEAGTDAAVRQLSDTGA